ncbi:Aste57867_23177 [Aphanomyces stellatus]|uniref:Aste57867_23177 protein n=1 Tax=Aphanomyces stellatus TaxID=120398 RepID=A0A485LMV3_9STRA|nr:hypothetical protein As57867_023106 [Aphanomyces stellatus]VFT99825.1 Aste57867_23177 [Aphanomyces stellatus]
MDNKAAPETRANTATDLKSLGLPPLQLDTGFSWRRAVASIVTYALLVSDVFRSGISIPTVPLLSAEPNVYFSKGPLAYSVFQSSSSASMTSSVPVATYKTDASAVALRAVAFNQGVWPACLDYVTDCAENTLPFTQVFGMLDQIASFVASQPPHPMFVNLPTPLRMALRIRMQHIHRFFDYVVSNFVDINLYASVWGAYFAGADAIAAMCTTPANGQPLLCTKSWARYDRVARGTPAATVGAIWTDVAARATALQATQPLAHVDLVVLESDTDPTPRNGGFIYVATSSYNVITILRLRDAATNVTLVVDEYRYEGTRLWAAPEIWSPWARLLRVVGQTYVFLRVLMLAGGCYVACDRAVAAAARLFVMLPSHVVVYGSWLPIVCYTLAHALDAPLAYALTEPAFDGPVSVATLINVVAVRMRSVWVLAFAIKLVGGSIGVGVWHASRGAISVKPHMLGFLAFLTVFFAFKIDALHDARVLDRFDVEPSSILAFYLTEGFASLNALPGGAYGDIVTLLAGILAHVVVHAVTHLLFPCVGWRTDSIAFFSDTPLPFAAHVYWSPTAMTVGWNDFILVDGGASASGALAAPRPSDVSSLSTSRLYSRRSTVSLFKADRLWEPKFSLMNIVHMTDPLTYLYLASGDVEIYQYAVMLPATGKTQLFLHPYDQEAILHHYVDVRPSDIRLDCVRRTRDLPWCALVQCF